MAHCARAFAPQAEGWVFESQPQQTQVIKAGSDSYTRKCSAIGVSVTGPRRWPLLTDAPCHSRCSTLKNPHHLAMSVEHRSKFAALHWQWWRLHMSEKFSSGTENPKQTNKQTNKHKMSIKPLEMKLLKQSCWNNISRCLHLFKWKRVKTYNQFALNVSNLCSLIPRGFKITLL